MNSLIKNQLPNPFTTDYQYSKGPLDLYTEEQMLSFAEKLIKENAKIVKKRADWWGTMTDEIKNEIIIDSANALLKHYGLPVV